MSEQGTTGADVLAHHEGYFSDEQHERRLKRAVIASLVLHAVVLGIILGSSIRIGERSPSLGRPIEVTLVDLPREKPRPVARPAPAPGAEAKVPAASRPAQAQRDALFLKRRAELEREKEQQRKQAEAAATELAQRRSERERLKQALAELERLKTQEVPAVDQKQRSAEDVARELEEKAALESAGQVAATREEVFRSKVLATVREHWSPPTSVARDHSLATTVELEVTPDGTLRGYRIVKSSGKPAFDDSVLRALGQIRKFPPPPPEMGRTFDVRFINREAGR